MDRKVDRFYGCAKQAMTISSHLDVAEDYLSKDPELALRLRVSDPFMLALDGLREWEDKNVMRGLCGRLKNVLNRVKEAVDSVRVYSTDHNFDFAEEWLALECRYHGYTALDYCNHIQRLEHLKEARRLASLSFEVYQKISATVDIANSEATEYLNFGNERKALEMVEEAYRVRSEHVEPADLLLQEATLQICKLLSRLKKYERMIEYLDVVMDNVLCHCSDVEESWPRCNYLYLQAEAIYYCAAFLPPKHPKRLNVFAQAFQAVSVCYESQIKCLTTMQVLAGAKIMTRPVFILESPRGPGLY
jgi:tetratricopeptide (TPR) repeat protein